MANALKNVLGLENQMGQIPESPVEVGNNSPKARMVCTADHSSQQSPLSCEGSVCDRSSDYEDFWRPLSSGTSPGGHVVILS